MKKLVVFIKQKGEIENAYSLVSNEIFKTIPKEIIESYVEVEDKLYTKEEILSLVNSRPQK